MRLKVAKSGMQQARGYEAGKEIGKETQVSVIVMTYTEADKGQRDGKERRHHGLIGPGSLAAVTQ